MNLWSLVIPSGPELVQAAISAGAVLLGIFILVLFLKGLLFICAPNEVLIVIGRKSRMDDGTVRGFRPYFSGRVFRIPIIESIARMGLNTMEVPIQIRGAYSKGGIPMNVDAIANIKISSDPNIIGNAIERFLGRDISEIRRVSKETLEGHLRGVLAKLTPEEVNEDRLKFAEELSRESEEDLVKLGLHVDTLKIQHVTDDVRYLSSIGREAIANVVKEAEMAESDWHRVAELAEASNQGRAKVAQANVEANVVRMRNDLRRQIADMDSQVKSEEERTLAAAKEARAVAEKALQQVRAELEGLRLQVERVLPAEAKQEAEQYAARGEAAIIRERGRAVAEALHLLHEAWNKAGASALQIALIEDIEKIMATAVAGVQRMKIQGVHVIDSGQGETLAKYAMGYPQMLEATFQALDRLTGLNVPEILSPQFSHRMSEKSPEVEA